MKPLDLSAPKRSRASRRSGAAEQPLSRRQMLSGGAMLAALFGPEAWAQSAEPSGPRDPGVGASTGKGAQGLAAKGDTGTVNPILRRLVNRVTMGFSQEEYDRALALGYNGYIEYHLNHTAIDDSAVDFFLSRYATLFVPPYQLPSYADTQVASELIQATIYRAAFSRRSLFERMVEFWTDHFNIFILNELDRYLKSPDDRDVIRANALTTFPQILRASMHSPAMLFYLDNYASVVGNPNENYSRELLELHTLGVDGGYTQQDVLEVARCLTGWTFWGRNSGNQTFTFRFNANIHDNGPKRVLGYDIPAGGGYNDGLIVHDILSNHPSTARFIGKKLARWFWGENPPEWLIQRVAQTYTATGGDIKAMLRTVLAYEVLATAPPKYKRPFHVMTSTLRALSATVTEPRGLHPQLQQMGQIPFYWIPPDGYPDRIDHWVGLILPRWNFGASLLNNNIPGASVNLNILAGATTAAAIVDRINALMFGGGMSQTDREVIRNFLLPDPPPDSRKRDALGLAVATPGFQWY